jgi:predicted metalloprotease with PDZ domain
MIHYKISCSNPASQFVEIELTFQNHADERVLLQLPAWRAGRYQLANYAQNIRGFQVKDSEGKLIPFQKLTKDLWGFQAPGFGDLKIQYEFWAGKMDAGSAWTDDQQVYLNLINCCFEPVGRSEEEYEVMVNLPDYPMQVSTLIPVKSFTWKASNFQMLADSTILAAKHLRHLPYQIGDTSFHIWVHGEIHFDESRLINQFTAFSSKMIQDFGEFPEPEYHFVFQLLSYPHYHGVEHRRGTVITFGPAESLSDPEQMEELLGISCHELYHAWNVCRIRPKELLPYDFSKEAYSQAGLILEGVTTYMGDLYLLKSGVYDLPTYLKHLEKIISRESSHFGWKNYTIQESSHDLWLDGYIPGIPDRKVNIYTRGALLALGIDLILLKNDSSLSKVMKRAWENFGKPRIGYEWQDFENLIFGACSDTREITKFFSDFVYGKQDLFPVLDSLLSDISLGLKENKGKNKLLHGWGIRVDNTGIVTQLHPESKAYLSLMRQDKILTSFESPMDQTLHLEIDRLGRTLEIYIPEEIRYFFPEIKLEMKGENSAIEKWLK